MASDDNEFPANYKQNILDTFLKQVGLSQQERKFEEEYPPNDKDLTEVTINDYPTIEITEDVTIKIEYLQKIILSIESRNDKYDLPDLSKKTFKIDYSKCLNPEQLTAVTTINGPILVIAGAGSGKTRIIVHRVSYLLENGINPKDILLLTFTRKAAKEMLSRVQELLKDKSVEKITGGTFHSFSNYLLRKYSNLLNIPPNFTIIDTEDSTDVIDLIRTELKFNKSEKKFLTASRLQDIFSTARNCNTTVKKVIERDFSGLWDYVSDIELIFTGFTQYKQICNIFDYDDLMEFLRNSLRDNFVFRNSVQKEYCYIMVDEFQDTNIVQKEIVEYISESHRNIMVVGDDAQSIYSFRGANYENILRFPEKYSDCRVIKIQQNYRSNQKILDFTNSIIYNAKLGYRKKLFSVNNNEFIPVVSKFYNQEDEAEFIVKKILELRELGIPLNKIAVLNRAVWHCRYIEMELVKRGIPYIVVGGIKFSERKHIKDIISYLRILLNPHDAVAWHRILKLIEGIGKVTASKIIEELRKNKDKFTFSSLSNRKYFNDLIKLESILIQANNPKISIAKKIGILKDYYSPIIQSIEDDYQIRLLDIDVLIDLSLKYIELEKFLTDFALDPPSKRFQDKSQPLIDETEDKPVVLSTVHSAKGLEWYCVFIPHALDGLFPSIRAIKNIEELEEERRLFYVACSRAKEKLFITMPSFISSFDSIFSYPSRFLIEIEHQKYEYLNNQSG